MRRSLAVLVTLLVSTAARGAEPVAAHPDSDPAWDAAYTRAIREHTTSPELSTPLVDHLPASATVPTPLSFLGYVAGAEGRLTYAADIHRYMRALEAASPRVKVFSLGSTEEGREMILVAVADEATIAALDEYRRINAALADPRATGEAEAAALIARGKPVYYLTGGLHSPETGAPEMLMELAYRLAVEDTDMVRSIRANVITLITPVLEVDGRERMVDLARWHAAHPDRPSPRLAYWGHYVVHDNNRDAVGLALALSRNLLGACQQWHPQVLHDLHESIPFLYVSTGTGPYNAWLDPLMVQQWERMAAHEVQTLTAAGLPGVWTHGFYDGWAPGYLFWLGIARNAVGRFYETFGNHFPDTEERVLRGRFAERDWFRPNPPYPTVRWSLRNNVNYQQSGVLVALAAAAAERRQMLEGFYRLGQRAVAKARTEGPAAWVLPGDQKRRGQLRDLAALLETHGVEVHRLERELSIDPLWPPKKERPAGEAADGPAEAKGKGAEDGPARRFPAGSLVVRMDQPMSRFADALLDTQFVRGEERVYDDTGWTVGMARNLETARIVNPAVLDAAMSRWTAARPAPGAGLVPERATALAVAGHADTDLARLRFRLPELRLLALESASLTRRGPELPAGTVVADLAGADRGRVAAVLSELDLDVTPLAALPDVSSHPLATPRVALLHSWLDTEQEGWYRLALEELGIPYDYLSTQDVAGLGELRARWDVVLFPPAGGSPQEITNGLPPGPAMPWQRTELTPNLGVDETPDQRPGLGLNGVRALARFVEQGGVLITVGDTARWAMAYGLARDVEELAADKVKASGTLLTAAVTDAGSPLASGYDATVPVYFAGGPVMRVGNPPREREERRPSGRGGPDDPDVPQGRPFVPAPPRPTPRPGEEGFEPPEGAPAFYASYLQVPPPELRPRAVLSFPKEAKDIRYSGMLEGAAELAGKALVVDCPLGSGHVLLFGINPMWRQTTQGTWALVVNALVHHGHLGIGRVTR